MTAPITETEQPGSRRFRLDDRYRREEGVVHVSGIQALVRVLLDRSRRDNTNGLHTATFVSGYEGSPLAGYDIELSRRGALLHEHDIVHKPGLNEELAATAVMGSQLAGQIGTSRCDGVVGIWYGKSPGLDRASDALRHANLVGTGPFGGAVALVGDDPGAKSSSVPCASEATLADLAIPTLYPADAQDVLDFGLHAQFLSRFSGLWSGLKITTAVADSASTAVVARDRITGTEGDGSPSPHKPSSMLLGANLMGLERSLHDIRLPRAVEYARLNGLNRVVQRGPSDKIGILTSGKTYLDVREALRIIGLTDTDLARYGIRILKLGMIFPSNAMPSSTSRTVSTSWSSSRRNGRSSKPPSRRPSTADPTPRSSTANRTRTGDRCSVTQESSTPTASPPGCPGCSRGSASKPPAHGVSGPRPVRRCRCRSWPATRTTARGVRTTPRPPPAGTRWSALGSAATPWSCSWIPNRSARSSA